MPSNALEQAAIDARNNLLTNNTFKVNANDNYGANHPNALSDGDQQGKGNPNASLVNGAGNGYYNIEGNVGSDFDINGNPNQVGSGRIQNVTNNQYDFNNGYQTPDTSGNVGQVVL